DFGGQVALVEDCEARAVSGQADYVEVGGVERARPVEHREQQVGGARRAECALDADALDVVGRLADAGGIVEDQGVGTELNRVFDDVAGGAGDGGDDGAVGAEQKIHQGRFTGVRLTENGRVHSCTHHEAAREAVVQHCNVADQTFDLSSDFATRRQANVLVGKIDLDLKMRANCHDLRAQLLDARGK